MGVRYGGILLACRSEPLGVKLLDGASLPELLHSPFEGGGDDRGGVGHLMTEEEWVQLGLGLGLGLGDGRRGAGYPAVRALMESWQSLQVTVVPFQEGSVPLQRCDRGDFALACLHFLQ